MSTETEKYEKEMETCTLDAVIDKLIKLRDVYGGKCFCVYTGDAYTYHGVFEVHDEDITYEGGKIHLSASTWA